MNDPIISDEEKNALLESVENGAVEVRSANGVAEAQVEPFAIPLRNRIVSRSFPRLKTLNRNLAGSFSKSASGLLNEKVLMQSRSFELVSWGEFMAGSESTAIIFEFSAAPMNGSAVIHIDASLVRYLVEIFYGGARAQKEANNPETFTQGEKNVSALFCEDLLQAIRLTWKGLAELDLQRVAIHQSNDIVEIIEDGMETVACNFEVSFGEQVFELQLVWPVAMLSPFLPVLEGQKQARNEVEDKRWEQVIRSRLQDSRVSLTTYTGATRASLRQVANLGVGDIVSIAEPRAAKVCAGRIPVIEGRFGTHGNQFAVEVSDWASAELE